MRKNKNIISQSGSEGDISKISKKVDERNISNELEENLNKIPKLAKEYYSVPSLSEAQKQTMQVGETIDGRTKEALIGYIDNKKCPMIIIKKKIEGKEDEAYVRECIDGMPEKFKGKQLFNIAAAKNLNIQKLLPTHGNLSKILGERKMGVSDDVYAYNNNLIKKFIQENNLLNIGFYRAKAKPEQISGNDLCYVDSFRYYLLSANGRTIEINTHDDKIEKSVSGLNKDHCYPVMLIQK